MKRIIAVFLYILIGSYYLSAQNIQEYYDMDGNRYTRWFPELFTIKMYDQQIVWREHPNPKFNLYLNPLGVVAGADWGGPSLDVEGGVRFNRNFFLGLETGFHSLGDQMFYGESHRRYFESFVPVALNIKMLFPFGKRCCPYVDGSLGGYFGTQDLDSNGLYVKAGVGFEFNRIVIGTGYTAIPVNGYFRNLGYVRFGFRIGR